MIEISEINDLKWVRRTMNENLQGVTDNPIFEDIDDVLNRCIERLEAKFEMARFMLAEKP